MLANDKIQIYPPSSVDVSQARVFVESPLYDEDFLFKFVAFDSGHHRFLAIVYDVVIFEEKGTQYNPKHLKLRNLLTRDQNTSQVSPVRNAPRSGSAVRFATEKDLDEFFERKNFPECGYLGTLRGTKYPLPIDIDKLCFANAAILAGINHGKSHLAALIVAQYHLTGKKVLVIDPSGEWPALMIEKRDALQKIAGVDLKISSFVGDRIPFIAEDPKTLGPNPPAWITDMWKAFNADDVTIVDVSLAGRGDLTAEMKQDARCEIAYHVQQILMGVALATYGKTKKLYSTPTCIVLEEAHQFVPSEPAGKYQKWLCTLFSISTKEYRKYGSGHLFIDQSLKAIHESLQIQTFFLGTTTQPADLRYMQERLGSDVTSAAQRTTGGAKSSWAVLGAATPLLNLPWEIESYNDSEFSFLAKGDTQSQELQTKQ